MHLSLALQTVQQGLWQGRRRHRRLARHSERGHTGHHEEHGRECGGREQRGSHLHRHHRAHPHGRAQRGPPSAAHQGLAHQQQTEPAVHQCAQGEMLSRYLAFMPNCCYDESGNEMALRRNVFFGSTF